jgi:hypothetical protein
MFEKFFHSPGRLAATVAGAILVILSLPVTVAEGVAGWSDWLAWFDGNAVRNALVAVGVVIILIAVFWPKIRPPSLLKTSLPSPRPLVTKKDLESDTIRGRAIRVVDLPRLEDGLSIRGRTLEDCDLIGPAVIRVLDLFTIESPEFYGLDPRHLDDIWIPFDPGPVGRGVVGVMFVEPNCKFRRCRFDGVGLIAEDWMVKRFKFVHALRFLPPGSLPPPPPP